MQDRKERTKTKGTLSDNSSTYSRRLHGQEYVCLATQQETLIVLPLRWQVPTNQTPEKGLAFHNLPISQPTQRAEKRPAARGRRRMDIRVNHRHVFKSIQSHPTEK